MIAAAFAELAPHKVCAYLYDLANAFNHFYHETKILAQEDEARQAGYIRLLQLCMGIMETCIDVLGFSAPERKNRSFFLLQSFCFNMRLHVNR